VAFERLVPDTREWDLYLANHRQRYAFAADLLRAKCTHALDAACGVGYGSRLLGENGMQVVGVDRDNGALNIARSKFAHANVKFLEDDCQQLANVGSSPFDAIVSFETLEHLPEPSRFLARCYAVLRPSGLLVMSTPNRNLREGSTKEQWEYHEKEYSAREFVGLLQVAGFRDVNLWGQNYTAIGHLRDQVRAELNRIHSNPLFRIGWLLQWLLRGYPPRRAVLPESSDDFRITPITCAEEADGLGKAGPFVLLATAHK
jgi:SAM-dependent methyltransferase